VLRESVLTSGPESRHFTGVLETQKCALVELGQTLKASRYSFSAITPESHRRVFNRSPSRLAGNVRDVFGWNFPFRPEALESGLLALMTAAGAVEIHGDFLKSKFRAATLGDDLFFHSSFPTDHPDSVFFGPDTYRFVRFVRQHLPRGLGLLADVGAGSGAGGLALRQHSERLLLTDINPGALQLAEVNARLAGTQNYSCLEGTGLAPILQPVDAVILNPPFLMDEGKRAYRDGGDQWGSDLSFRLLLGSLEKVRPGGLILLYTASAVVDGVHIFRELVRDGLKNFNGSWDFDEIDPDVFGEELSTPAYKNVERISAVGLVVRAGRE